ncbi:MULTISPECIES: hydroxymethylglutaryl-CoA lyase [unclassified Novosphingobium]|uniref:hydroxymethylglutaryl-CoA lyase n=1 Tax=unclassified Novosphingobium TaxID=2644732 RepID=UPI001493E7E7|nr:MULTISPECIES: hydroxymethylglutaryl-CoA lyase [unclassified Novosphingobium]MBB3357909.1 hydroxymethylglutaryl-CoA lyase [Novosphingobium sp. BK256]MBB3374270.1 hydroxymethylglutaryl-CoA lyase [Novosphingobium sp. BK280]MBB3378682.1 hydroxymethylglutaryl-CoA lyase [Novosphingobium sp. BK258]MBB3420376.1 hydroxymethylglutaryl-CoA lyase [Novosphingobium sp. BK267]MBB3448502.1 hydroxymethylglutaryl-CoA lyase [Novosphingobium sp. BK352]
MYTESIEMVEVAPRDGLQNEKTLISTADKIALVERAIAAGARRIEVTSFVNPKAVPQMADAEAVCAGLPRRDDVTYIGLVMNARGAARAIETGRIDQLGAVSVATDTFAKANQGQTSDGSVVAASEIIAMARQAGKTGQVTIAAAFGCPFEGEVSEDRVVAMAVALAQAAPVEIGLADTIGVANPAHVATLVGKVRAAVPAIPVRVHFHNTRGTGLANVWAAIGAGAVTVDAAIGGLGGCPFAPGAAGNVSTEDVVYMLERAGVGTGLDLAALVEANHWLGTVMDRTLPGMVAKAPPFPRPAQA